MKRLKLDPKRLISAIENNYTLISHIKDKIEKEEIITPAWLVDDTHLLCAIVDSYNDILLSIYEDYDENAKNH